MQLSSISLAITSLTGGLFTPQSLFTTGVTGVWYDPSDFSTLFQDSAGTTPVTAMEQPVGLMLDKSKGLVLGPELVTNGDFSQGTTGWSLDAGWSIADGVASCNGATGFLRSISPTPAMEVGKWYQASFRLVSRVSGGVYLPYDGTGLVTAGSTPGVYSDIFLCDNPSRPLIYSNAFVGSIDNISVRELPGNHAFQSTSANRPPLSARYNLLTKSEQFDDAVWTKLIGGTGTQPVVTQNSATAPNGSITAAVVSFGIGSGTTLSDLSVLEQGVSVVSGTQYRGAIYVKAATPGDVGKSILMRHAAAAAGTIITLTASWQRVSSTENAFGTGTTAFRIGLRGSVTSNSVSVAFWGADLRVSNDALNQPAYQRVNTSTDYDTEGFKPYLLFNGTNQWLQTNSIDFSYGDKIFVAAGVRKLSDATIGSVAGLSSTPTSNSGTFEIYTPQTNGGANHVWYSRGTTTSGPSAGPYIAPITNVISGIGDIGGNYSAIRVNGALGGTGSVVQGTVNYGNYPLYIGARAGTSLFFNGRLYGLVVAGKQASAGEISSTETYLNQRTGAY